MTKRNKNLELSDIFVEKDPSDEVDLLVDGPNFDADEVSANNSNDENGETLKMISIVVIGEILLELRENLNIYTAVTCFVSKIFSAIINIDQKQHTEMFHRSYPKKIF